MAMRSAFSLMRSRARRAVAKAIRDGMLHRQPCERCAAATTEAHHDNYNNHLDVRWLCHRCHVLWHTTFQAFPVAEGEPFSYRLRPLTEKELGTVAIAFHAVKEMRAAGKVT
jgi:ribosomal protein S27AE